MRDACAYSTGSADDLLEARHPDHLAARDRPCADAAGRAARRGRGLAGRARRRLARVLHRVRIGRRLDRPGASTRRRVELDEARRARAGVNEVPRRSRISAIGVPAARRCAMLDDRALGVAVDEQIGVRVDEHRAPDLVGPVVVVRDPPQARLDAADHDAARRLGTPRGSAARRRSPSDRGAARRAPSGEYASSERTFRSLV